MTWPLPGSDSITDPLGLLVALSTEQIVGYCPKCQEEALGGGMVLLVAARSLW